MKYDHFNMTDHGFVGHLVEPDLETKNAVIVIMGGEKSILPGVKIAERFAEYGFLGLSVSLFGAPGLPNGVDRIPVDMFEQAIRYLREVRQMKSISAYGMSMGSLFAALAAKYVGNIDAVILVSPSHVPFEGSLDKKNMTGHSMATWRGQELPFVKPDFSHLRMSQYIFSQEANRKVMGMWVAYREAYQDKVLEQKADIQIEQLKSRILMIAGTGDEAWPSDYSVLYLKQRLDENQYPYEYKAIVYPNASHLLGVLPGKKRNKWLYWMLPLIAIIYKSLGAHRQDCLEAFSASEHEVIEWIKKSPIAEMQKNL